MRSAQVYRWQIPMDAGVVLRDRRLKTRDGLYVCLREGEREGWGEISPLPGFSQETWEEAQSVLLAWVNNWLAGDCELPQMPSVAFGVSCALAELADTLPQAANYRAAPLCNGDPDDLILKLADMPGEKVAKVKVGLYEAVRDGMVVNLLLEAIPDLHLRLDANRAWTPLKGQQFAKYVNPDYRHRIAFLEEPCKTRDDSRAFARETGIAIAWDESLREPDFAFVAERGRARGSYQTHAHGQPGESTRAGTGGARAGADGGDQFFHEFELRLNATGADCRLVNARHHSGAGHAGSDGAAESASLAGVFAFLWKLMHWSGCYDLL